MSEEGIKKSTKYITINDGDMKPYKAKEKQEEKEHGGKEKKSK